MFKPTIKFKTIRDDLLTDKNPRGLTLDEMVSKLKAKIIGRNAFWGVLIAPIDISFSENENIKTACTNGESIIFDIDFFLNSTWGEAAFVLAHEVWHIANLHIPRLQARHPQIWNQATDHWINLLLKDEVEANPNLFSVPDFPRLLGNPEAQMCMDERFRDLAPEAVYAILIKEFSKQDNGDEDASGDNNAMGSDLDYEGFANSNGTETQEEKAKRLESEWKKRMSSAMDAGRKAGNMSGGLARWAEALLQPKIDWQTALAAYLSFQPSDYEWTSPDRRFTDWPFVVPDIVGEKLKFYAAIDTSGSITNEMISGFISELHGILLSFNHVDGVLIGHDHVVHDVIDFDKTSPPTGFTGGGGGTDFHCVVKEIEDNHDKPVVLIWWTDGYAEWPAKPDYPVIFVLVDTPLEAPEWATGIHIQTH